MIQPFPSQPTHSLIPAPTSVTGSEAGLAIATLTAAGSGPAPVDFVTVMAESVPLPFGLTAKSDQIPKMELQNKDAAVAGSMLGQSSVDPLDPLPKQDGAMPLQHDGSAGFTSPELPDPAFPSVTAPAVVSTSLPPPPAPQVSQEPDTAAKAMPVFSLAAMAFSDRSATAQPSAAKENPAPPAIDDPRFPATRDSAAPSPDRREGILSASDGEIAFSARLEPDLRSGSGQSTASPSSSMPGPEIALLQRDTPNQLALATKLQRDSNAEEKAQGMPERPASKAAAAAFESPHSKPRPVVGEASPSLAERPVEISSDREKNVSDRLETPPARQTQSKARGQVAGMSPSPSELAGLPPKAPPHEGGRFHPDTAATPEASRLRSSSPDAPPAPLPLQIGLPQVASVAAPSLHLTGGYADMRSESRLHAAAPPAPLPAPLPVQIGLQQIMPVAVPAAPSIHLTGSDSGIAPEPRLHAAVPPAPLPAPLPVQIGLPQVSSVAAPSLHLTGGDADIGPEPRLHAVVLPEASQVPQVIQTTVGPNADVQLHQARPRAADHTLAASIVQQAPPAVNDTSLADGAVPADRQYFVTNSAEIRVHPQDHDPASPVLIAIAAEAGLGPQQDDPAPTRPATAQVPLTAEILRLVQTPPDGPVTLTLRPDDLGTLRFEVTQTEHGLHIHLSVDQPQTLDLLRRQGDQLLADLRQAGFAGASLSFAGDGAQDAPPQPRDQPQHSLYPSGTKPALDHPSPHAPRIASSGTLDLRL